MSTDAGFYSIIDYTVDGFTTQREWVHSYPGYRSARFHASTDVLRVYTIVHWASEADYRAFVQTSDGEARMGAIREALEGLSGSAELRMTEAPTYTVVHEVGPGPRHLDP